jgi:elongation factor G
MSKGLARFRKEDPTFHVFTDDESGETRIAGMGELHLEIYVERLAREYKAEVKLVLHRLTTEKQSVEADFDYTHKKQTGGSGQFGQVVGVLSPLTAEEKEREDQNFMFINNIKGGSIPSEYIGACEKGFEDVMDKGPLAAFPLINVKLILMTVNIMMSIHQIWPSVLLLDKQ